MKLEKYDRESIPDGMLVWLVDAGDDWMPGAQVRHMIDESAYGIVVAVDGSVVTVMWSKPPVDYSKYSTIANPLRRRLNYTETFKNLINVQPLPPNAAAHYYKK